MQALLDDLGFKGFWVRVSLAHGDPLAGAKNGVHLNRWTPLPLTLGSGRCVGQTLTDISQKVQTGQVYERLSAQLPIGKLNVQVELRHTHYNDKRDKTELGMRFFKASGNEQRLIERFVFQLQREARDLE